MGLVYSQQTAWFRGDGRIEDHVKGWYQALVEARIPFEMVHDRLLDAAHLGRFKTLILPNVVALSDAQCAAARASSSRAAARSSPRTETSLCDERGRAAARTSAWPASSA